MTNSQIDSIAFAAVACTFLFCLFGGVGAVCDLLETPKDKLGCAAMIAAVALLGAAAAYVWSVVR